MKTVHALIIISVIAFLFGCNKNKVVTELDTTSVSGNTNLKIVHTSAYAVNTPVQLKVNDIRISSNISYCTPFPGGGLNTGGSNMPWYLSLNAGTSKISMSFPKAGTNTDSIPLFSGNLADLLANTYYTTYIVDTGSNTKQYKINENTILPAEGTSRFKFIHLMPNLPAVDLYWGSIKVADNIAYGAMSKDFVLNRSDTAHWFLRVAGASPLSTPITIYPAGNLAPQTVPNRRLFTVFSRGYLGSTGNRLPNISLLYN